MTFLMPLPAAHVQKLLDWADERSKLGRSLPLGGGLELDTQHYDLVSCSRKKGYSAKDLPRYHSGQDKLQQRNSLSTCPQC